MISYATTWLDVGNGKPLRRRDRASLVLAYECVREDGTHPLEPNDMLRSLGGPVASAIGEAAHEAWERFADDRAWHTGRLPGNGDRLLRARLALALRWLIRVDAYGIPEPWTWRRFATCKRCQHEPVYIYPRCERCGADLDVRLVVPLWDSLARDGRSP